MIETEKRETTNPNHSQESPTVHKRPAFPFAVILLISTAVWGTGVINFISEAPNRVVWPHIRSGSASELVSAINAAPRSMVYVGCPVTTYGVYGQRMFQKSVEQVNRNRPEFGIKFFVIKDEAAEDSQEWIESLQDKRLAEFGHLGYGWILWLEYGLLREVDPYSGDYHHKEMINSAERTLSIWPE